MAPGFTILPAGTFQVCDSEAAIVDQDEAARPAGKEGDRSMDLERARARARQKLGLCGRRKAAPRVVVRERSYPMRAIARLGTGTGSRDCNGTGIGSRDCQVTR